MLERNSFVILSACKGTIYDEQNTAQLKRKLSYLRYCHKQVIGCYGGQTETSFVVPVECLADIQELLYEARDFCQESILVVNGQLKDAELWLCASGKRIPVGKWKQVESIGHLPEDSGYTIDNTNIYTCV